MDKFDNYADIEIAFYLKKAGYDWECPTCYIGGDPTQIHEYSQPFNWNMPREEYEKDGSNNNFYQFINQKGVGMEIGSAPTLAVIQKWLRLIHHYHITINVSYAKGDITYFITCYKDNMNITLIPSYENKFNDYYDALKKAIYNCLQLIINEKHKD